MTDLIEGFALISVNDKGEGTLYELDDTIKSFTFFDVDRDTVFDMDDEYINSTLTPEGVKDSLVMVYFTICSELDYFGDYDEWIEIESYKVLQENHCSNYLKNLRQVIGSLRIDPLFMDPGEVIPDIIEQEVERLIHDYESFFGKKFEE